MSLDGKTGAEPYEVRKRAVRLVFDHERQYGLQWGAMRSIAEKISCTGETMRRCVRQTERPAEAGIELLCRQHR